jgi:hypothetical protein
MPTSILKPRASTVGTTPVRLDVGSSSTGFICAEGDGQQSGGANPTEVWGRIVKIDGALPPLDKTQSTQGEFLYNLFWRISAAQHGDIPNAQCGGGMNPVQNRLAVYMVYPGGASDATPVIFSGVCGYQTECGSGMMTAMSLHAATAQPTQLAVSAAGFTAEAMTAFNGTWALKSTNGGHGLWSNGGDGKKALLVELRLDVKSRLWQLTFKLKRKKAVYAQSSTNWSWTRDNDLLFTGGDPAKKGVPQCVCIKPA